MSEHRSYWGSLLQSLAEAHLVDEENMGVVVNRELETFVDHVGDLINDLNGEGRSRQTLALAVATWQAMNPTKAPWEVIS